MKSARALASESSNHLKSEVAPRLQMAQSLRRTRPPKRPMLQKATDDDTMAFNGNLFYLEWQRKVMNYYALLIGEFYLTPLKKHLQSSPVPADSAEQRSLRLRLAAVDENQMPLSKSVAKLKTVTIVESSAVFRLTRCLRAMATIESTTSELIDFLRSRPRKYIKPLCELKKFIDTLFHATCALGDVWDLPPVEMDTGESGGGDVVKKPPHQMKPMEFFVNERVKHMKPLMSRINYTRAFAHIALKKLIGMVQLIINKVPVEDLNKVTVKQLRTVRSSLPPRYLFPAVNFDVQTTTKTLLPDPPSDNDSDSVSVDYTTREIRRNRNTDGSARRRSRSSKRQASCPPRADQSQRSRRHPSKSSIYRRNTSADRRSSSEKSGGSSYKSSAVDTTSGDNSFSASRTSATSVTTSEITRPVQSHSRHVSRKDRHEKSAQMRKSGDIKSTAAVAKKLA